MDFDVEAVLEAMSEFCDAQGRLFVAQALETIRANLEKGVCVRRRPQEVSSCSRGE